MLLGYVLSTYSARKLGLRTTGNAGGTHNLIVHGRDRDFDGMLALMDRGLLVTELMGQGVNGVTGDYSRGAAGFWVENGRLAYPVHEVTIAGNLRDMYRAIVDVGCGRGRARRHPHRVDPRRADDGRRRLTPRRPQPRLAIEVAQGAAAQARAQRFVGHSRHRVGIGHGPRRRPARVRRLVAHGVEDRVERDGAEIARRRHRVVLHVEHQAVLPAGRRRCRRATVPGTSSRSARPLIVQRGPPATNRSPTRYITASATRSRSAPVSGTSAWPLRRCSGCCT